MAIDFKNTISFGKNELQFIELFSQSTDNSPISIPNTNQTWQNTLLQSYNLQASQFYQSGDSENAQKIYKNSIDIIRTTMQNNTLNKDIEANLLEVYDSLANIYLQKDDISNAKKLFLEKVDIVKKLITSNPTNYDLQKALASTYGRLGDIYISQKDVDSAKDMYKNSLEINSALSFNSSNINRFYFSF